MSLGISADDLSDIIKERDNGSLDKINKDGGVEGLMKKLKTDKKSGLSSQVCYNDHN